MDSVIIIGAGNSAKSEWKSGLFDKISRHEIWSLNSVYKVMPYLPTKQFWVDREFFDHEVDNLEKLRSRGVELVSKLDIRKAGLKSVITQYPTTRITSEYYGQKAIERNLVYYGQMGLCGMFALSVAIARGYKKIWLLGYDFGVPNINQVDTHWYQDEIPKFDILSSGAGRPEVYMNKDQAYGVVRKEVSDFDVYLNEKDVEILNVSPQSNIYQFKKVDYGQFYNSIS